MNASLYKKLSRKEIKVLELIACKLSDKEIAEKLCRSLNTIKKHHQNIRNKTGAHNIGDLIVFAEQQGLFENKNEVKG